MRSEKQPNGGFFVSEKSQAQKSADSRQRKKAKIARHVQALKDSEHNNGVLREVLVAQSNEILEKQIVVKDQSSQITQLKNVASSLGDRVHRLQAELSSEFVLRQEADHRFENLRRASRGASRLAVGEFLTSLHASNDDISSSASLATCDQD